MNVTKTATNETYKVVKEYIEPFSRVERVVLVKWDDTRLLLDRGAFLRNFKPVA